MFFGVVRMVMVKLWRTSWWVRSKSGIMWPVALCWVWENEEMGIVA